MNSMKEAREKSNVSSMTAVLILLLLALAGGYSAGYFALSTSSRVLAKADGVVMFEGNVRYFRYAWLARIYSPAAIVESVLTAEPVTTGHNGGSIPVILNR
jgi:hypothetical protein